jgi:hypothetical protein
MGSVIYNISASNTTSGGLVYSYKGSDFNPVGGYLYGVDTSVQTVTATLPANPLNGTQISFCDARGTFGTNQLTIDPNGRNIAEWSDSLTLTHNYEAVTLLFDSTINRWLIGDVSLNYAPSET